MLELKQCEESYDHAEQADVITDPSKTARALVRQTDFAGQPENDAASPIFEVIDSDYHPIKFTGYGAPSFEHSGLSDFETKFERVHEREDFNKTIEILDRYVRVFHGGRVIETTSDSGTKYIAFETREMLKYWGCGDDVQADPDFGDFLDWANGDVFDIEIEVRDMEPDSLFGELGINDFEQRASEWVSSGESRSIAYGVNRSLEYAVELMDDELRSRQAKQDA